MSFIYLFRISFKTYFIIKKYKKKHPIWKQIIKKYIKSKVNRFFKTGSSSPVLTNSI